MPLDPETLSNLSRSLEERLSIGQLAVLNGFVAAEALEACLREQRASGAALENLMLARKLITPDQLCVLKEEQALEEGGAPEKVERRIGRYALVRQVGAGGAGIVWKAWDTRLERWVAVKEPKLDRGVSRERFLREARAAARLRHPNLIQIFEVGEHEGNDYLVMDYVEGRRLDEVPLDREAAVALMAQVCDAVEAMHGCGVVHRDIKPQNILVDAQGAPHLGDFGLAKVAEAGPLTIEGGFLGTPPYVAPEQAAGKLGSIGPATDVYGLGATLYHALCGHPPFENEDAASILAKKLNEGGPRPLREMTPAIPEELAGIVGRAMESRPGDRYAGAAALAGDLRRFLRGEPLTLRPVNPVWRRLRRVSWTWALAGALALAAGGLWFAGARRDAAYETARQKGDEIWMRALGFLRGSSVDRDGLKRALEEAIRAYEGASREAPARPYPWLMQGRCRLLLGRGEEAEGNWSRALELDPAFGPARLERAKYHLASYARLRLPSTLDEGAIRFGPPEAEDPGARQKGQADLAAARGLDRSALSNLEGMLQLGEQKFEAAAASFRRYTDENPWDAGALAMQGASEYYAGRFSEAETTWTRVLALAPRAEARRARGHVRYALRRFAEAVADYDAALALAPENPDILCDRGTARQAIAREQEDPSLLDPAIADYTRAIELRTGFARALTNRGTAFAEKKDFEGAHRDFVEAQQAGPFYVEAYLNRGVAFLKQGKAPEAREEFDAAIEIDPSSVGAHSNRGLSRMLLLDFDGALDDLSKALARAPGSSEIHFQRAQARYGKKDTAGAIADLREALKNAPAGWSRRGRVEVLLEHWSRQP